MTTAIHWFRRDLRLRDNTALARAAAEAERLMPVFVLDDVILRRRDTGAARVRFLLDCLRALADDLAARGTRLTVLRGDPAEVLVATARAVGATTVHWNKDYEPYARSRDARVAEALAAAGIASRPWKDHVLLEEHEILNGAGRPFTVFTPYARVWRTRKAKAPTGLPRLPPPPSNARRRATGIPDAADLGIATVATLPKAGEAAARARLRAFVDDRLARYAAQRDFPGRAGTSGLSPDLKFGTVSIREVYAATSGRSAAARRFVTELAWRDFYHQLLFHHPNVEREAFRPDMRALAWENDRGLFRAWQAGETGYPIVDAAMRQLRAIGWMHNRARMIVASFLTKDLLIDWRWGERHFMRELIDGDLAANNGGWQWAASTGTDAQPWFRIFNPAAQGERYDRDGAYVRRWVPELADVSDRWIHRPWEMPSVDRPSTARRYPDRIVRHEQRRTLALALYRTARRA